MSKVQANAILHYWLRRLNHYSKKAADSPDVFIRVLETTYTKEVVTKIIAIAVKDEVVPSTSELLPSAKRLKTSH